MVNDSRTAIAKAVCWVCKTINSRAMGHEPRGERDRRKKDEGGNFALAREWEEDRTNTCPCHRRLSCLNPRIYVGQ